MNNNNKINVLQTKEMEEKIDKTKEDITKIEEKLQNLLEEQNKKREKFKQDKE